jgi:hypothetical protein
VCKLKSFLDGLGRYSAHYVHINTVFNTDTSAYASTHHFTELALIHQHIKHQYINAIINICTSTRQHNRRHINRSTQQYINTSTHQYIHQHIATSTHQCININVNTSTHQHHHTSTSTHQHNAIIQTCFPY